MDELAKDNTRQVDKSSVDMYARAVQGHTIEISSYRSKRQQEMRFLRWRRPAEEIPVGDLGDHPVAVFLASRLARAKTCKQGQVITNLLQRF